MWLLSISEVGLPFETERTPLTFDRVEAELASSLPHLEGSSDGPQRRRDVRRRSALRQPLGGSGEIARSPRYPQSPRSPVRARVERPTAGALRAGDEANGRRHAALRTREPRRRGPARGRAKREERPGSSKGALANLAAPGLRAVVGATRRLSGRVPGHPGGGLYERASSGSERRGH